MALTSQQYVVNRNVAGGAQLGQALDTLRNFLSQLENLRGKMVQARTNPAGGTNSTALAANFGLVDATTADAVFSQVDSVSGAIGLPATNPSGTINRADVWAAMRQLLDQVG